VEGGIREEPVPGHECREPVLSKNEVFDLVRSGRMIENLVGKPQDIEWAISAEGEIAILQSRDIRLSAGSRQAVDLARGEIILSGGVCASPGRSIGKVKLVHSMRDLEGWDQNKAWPEIMVLRQSFVDAAGRLPEFEGAIVDLGNPADHLSCVAREYSLPMLTGAGKATRMLQDGQWIVLDADRALILKAPEDIWADAATGLRRTVASPAGRKHGVTGTSPEATELRRMIEPLNLTDAYGPTFSIRECRSLHDIIRFTHEMAVLAMFQTGDSVLENAGMLVRVLRDGLPLHFLLIDLGEGITAGRTEFKIRESDIQSTPLLALLEGIKTPGLRWNQPAPVPGISGLLSRAMLDSRSARPVGEQNYALITRDYLNLNARVDFHFAMVDSICCTQPRENYIRFRFKGGGTIPIQRERRARFVAEVLREHDFFTDQRSDLVTASITEMQREDIEARLVMLGRLMGFSRLLDAAMRDDAVPGTVAKAFMDGDYGLAGL
jgi:pyruvate, water dikinase